MFEQGTAPAQVARIDLEVTLGSQQLMPPLEVRGPGGADITFPSSKVLQLRHGDGVFLVTATARDSGGAALATGSANGVVTRGDTLEVTVRFGTSSGLDGGMPDGGDSSDGGVAMLAIDPTSQDFGARIIGQATAPATVMVTNNGTAPTGQLQTALVGSDASRFTVASDSCAGMTLAPGLTCAITVTFQPTVEAAAAATLEVQASPGGRVATNLAGSGVQPGALQLTPATQDFGRLAPGTSSTATVFTARNTGGSATGTLAVSLSGSDASLFTIGNDSCNGTTLTAASTCTLEVRFRPTQGGARTAALRITGTPGGSAIADLSGAGLNPAVLTAAPASLAFGDVAVGASAAGRSFMVTNTGELPTSGLTVTNSNTAEFPITANTCQGMALGPGISCSVTVGFTPSMGGPRTTSVAISGGATVAVGASGRGMFRITVTRDVQGGGSCVSCVVQSSDTPASIDCGSTCTTLVAPGGTLTLTARQDNGAGYFFAGLAGASCVMPARSCPITPTNHLTLSARWLPLTGSLMFVTSSTVLPNLGGYAAYDAECNRIATSAGVNNAAGDQYVAWVGTAASPPRARIGATTSNFVRMDGRVVAVDLAALSSNTILNPVYFDELGRKAGTAYVTGLDGSSGNAVTSTNCADWTSSATFNYVNLGYPTAGPSGWQGLYSANCDGQQSSTLMHLLCVRKLGGGPPNLAPRTGRMIWITNSAFRVGTDGAPDAFCQRPAEVPAGFVASRARALVARTTAPASSRLRAGYDYIRPDGQFIGTSQEITAGTFTGGEWQSANGTYLVPQEFFLGADALDQTGTMQGTCNDWSSPTGAGRGNLTSIGAESFKGGNIQCNSTRARLYCVDCEECP